MSTPSLYVLIPLNQYHYERYSAYRRYHGLTNVDVVQKGLEAYLEDYEAWVKDHPGQTYPFGPPMEDTSAETSFKGYIDKDLKGRFQAFVDANKSFDGLVNYTHGYQQAVIAFLQKQPSLEPYMLPQQVQYEVGFLPEEYALLQSISRKREQPEDHLLYEALDEWLERCEQNQLLFPSYRIAPAPNWPATKRIVWLSLALRADKNKEARVQAFVHGVPMSSLLYTAFMHWASKQTL